MSVYRRNILASFAIGLSSKSNLFLVPTIQFCPYLFKYPQPEAISFFPSEFFEQLNKVLDSFNNVFTYLFCCLELQAK